MITLKWFEFIEYHYSCDVSFSAYCAIKFSASMPLPYTLLKINDKEMETHKRENEEEKTKSW